MKLQKHTIITLLILLVLALGGCGLANAGDTSKTKGKEKNAAMQASEPLGTRENPVDAADGVTFTAYQNGESGKVKMKLNRIWSGKDAEEKMRSLGDSNPAFALNGDEKLVLLKHTIRVVDGYKSNAYMPELNLVNNLYGEDMQTPLDGRKFDMLTLKNQIKNEQLMKQGDTLSGYTVLVVSNDVTVFYNCYSDHLWVKYKLND